MSVVVVLGCASAREPMTKAGEAQAPAAAPATDRARAYELGKPVRDYAAAAKIYEERCADGAGDVAACRRWMRASIDGRGADADRARVFVLAAKLCDARADGWSCMVTAMANPSERAAEALERTLATPCDAAHLDRCEMPRSPFSFSDSSSVEHQDRAFDRAGCELGVLEACARMRYAPEDARADAFERLGAACDQGDAMACEVVDRPIDPAVLCAAHDYEACSVLGCLGDPAAAERAIAHHVETDCDSSSAHALAARPVVPATQRPAFDSVEFHQLASPPAGALYFQIYNTGTRDIEVLIGAIYAYDAAGTQIARNPFEFRRPLASGHGTTLAVQGAHGESLDPCIDVIKFADDERPRLARCPARKASGARWGDGRDTVELQVSLADIPLADAWTDRLEPALCEPFEHAHLGIRVRAVSGVGVAVLLENHWLEPKQLAELASFAGPPLVLPLVREPTTIAYRVAGIDDLQLSARTLARIFQRQIARWNDPAIAADNPRHVFPPTPIVVLQDHGGSAQLRLTSYLASAARGAWKLGASRDAAFFAGVQRQTTDELVKTTIATDGAITYLGPGLAEAAGLHTARIRGSRGAFVAPTPAAITRGDYPLAAPRALYVFTGYPNKPVADAARAYAAWLLGDGLAIFERLGYGREPEPAIRAALARLRDAR